MIVRVWHRLGGPAFATGLVDAEVVPLPSEDSDVIPDRSNLDPKSRGSVNLGLMNLVQDPELRENLADAIGEVVGYRPGRLDGRTTWGMDVGHVFFVGHRVIV
jgi:hypothetical protein